MNTAQRLEHLRRQAEDSLILRRAVIERMGELILDTASLIQGVIGSGGKVLLAGNGEVAGAASHFAAQLMIRLNGSQTRQALPAIALAGDTTVMTAAANEFGYKEVFARQIEGLGHKGDLLIVLSEKGESENLIRAVQAARTRNMLTIGLLGNDGGRLCSIVDRALVVPHPSPRRVQEEQLFIIHLLIELIESDLFG